MITDGILTVLIDAIVLGASSQLELNPVIYHGLSRTPAISFVVSIQDDGLYYITTFGAKAELS